MYQYTLPMSQCPRPATRVSGRRVCKVGADDAAPCRTDRLVRFGFHLNDNDREMTNLCR
jgi:hypothetical protein